MHSHQEHTSDGEREIPRQPKGKDAPSFIGLAQRYGGNAAVARLVASQTAAALHPGSIARALLDEGRTGAEEFQAQPIGFVPAGPDPAAPLLNEDGLIDGEWISSVSATVFVNGGKAGSGIVNWAGGNGGTTPGIGSVTSVAPVIDTRAAAEGAQAHAWVRAGTGTVTVSRHYFGVPTGANGSYYITAAAAAVIDTHEQNHIAHSRAAHDAKLVPLEARIAARTGEAKALDGASEAAAKTALLAELKWNDAINQFRTQDNADNLPGGTVDTADAASAGFYKDRGPRAVAGVNYAHYVDV